MKSRKHKNLKEALLLSCLVLLLCTACGSLIIPEDVAMHTTAITDKTGTTDISTPTSGVGDEAPDTTDPTESTAALETESPQESTTASEESSDEILPSESTEEKQEEPMITDTTPFGLHDALHVADGKLKDAHGADFQLYGMSTHGIAWYPQYICKETIQYLHEEYGVNCLRLAMYTAEYQGYCTDGDKEYLKQLVKNGVDYATELGMYVIIDWHILSDNNPQNHKEEAKKFLGEMSETFKNQDNVLYEICNEPNNTDWNSVKTYAEEVIPVIRANDPDAVVIVGTPTWSQDLECPLGDPVGYDNLLYSLHFYAATHKDDLRERAQQCIDKGLPVFVSEFGLCDASGNGWNDFDSAQKWLDMIEQNNLSFMCWALGNRNEACCIILPDSDKLSQWDDGDLNESGKWILNYFKNKKNE